MKIKISNEMKKDSKEAFYTVILISGLALLLYSLEAIGRFVAPHFDYSSKLTNLDYFMLGFYSFAFIVFNIAALYYLFKYLKSNITIKEKS